MNLESYIKRQQLFSLRTFGPGTRTEGIIDHIKKELEEIRQDPRDLMEWVDVIIMALDGAWRAGYDAETICKALDAKYEKNAARKWPDWRDVPEGKAIEHIRTDIQDKPHANPPLNAVLPETSSNRGLRYNSGKPPLSYCNFGLEVIEGESRVWERGAQKYAPGNWTKGMPILESIDSLQRHIDAFQNGQNLDPESNLPHVDHIVCCAKILSNAYHTRPDFDDRPKKEPRPSQARWETKVNPLSSSSNQSSGATKEATFGGRKETFPDSPCQEA